MLKDFKLPFLLYTDSDKNGYTNKNFYYFIGFQPSFWYMLFYKNTFFIFLDSRYFIKLNKKRKNFIQERIWEEWKITFINLKNDIKIYLKDIVEEKKLYIEESMSLSFFSELQENGFELEILRDFFWKKRIIKNSYEKEKIKNAIKIIEKVRKQIEILNKKWELFWKTELWLRGFIIQKIFEFGWEWESFDSIVAFWKNSAIPHHNSSPTKIWVWPLLVDMWAIYRWYMSDFTRTLWVYNPSSPLKKWKLYSDFLKIQEIVKWAHDEWSKLVSAWVECSEIDKKVRDYIVIAWYGEYFVHSTGHWVGLDIHELPFINKSNNEILMSGMVFTIEPWIYFPWYFWVRYENIFIID